MGEPSKEFPSTSLDLCTVDHLKVLQDAYFRTLTLYLSWFSWFFTIFFAVIGFMVSIAANHPPHISNVINVFVGLLSFAALGLAISIGLYRYGARVEQSIHECHGSFGYLIIGGDFTHWVRRCAVAALTGAVLISFAVSAYLYEEIPASTVVNNPNANKTQ